MNNLTRLLLTTASVTALVISAQNTARADSATPAGGSGTITYGAGGVPFDETGAGGGFLLTAAPNDTVTLQSLTIDKTLAPGGSVNALSIDSSSGTLNIILSGTGSSLTEEGAEHAAALYVDNSGMGPTTLDTTGASSGSTFTGTQGIVIQANSVVPGGGDVSITTKVGDDIVANEDGGGFNDYNDTGGNLATGGQYSAGIFAFGPGNVTVVNNATIETDGTHNFDVGIGAHGANITVTNYGDVYGTWTGVLGEAGSGNLTVYNHGSISSASVGISQLGEGALTVHNYAGGVIQATTTLGEGGHGIQVNSASSSLSVTNDAGGFIGGVSTGILSFGESNSITNYGTIAGGTSSSGTVTLSANSIGIQLFSNATIINGMADGSVAALIEGGSFGIDTDSAANITNYANATIRGISGAGITASDQLTLVNLGTITSGETGHSGNVGVDVTNNATINNAGHISALTDAAIDVNGNGNTITNDSVGIISGGTAGYGMTFFTGNTSNTVNNYGSITGTSGGIAIRNSAEATINLFAGSTTGDIDTTTSGGGSVIALYTGANLTSASTDAATGAVEQASGALAAAHYGNITGAPGDVLQLRGNGRGADGAALGKIDLSTAPTASGIGIISGIGEIDKDDAGTWQFLNAAGDATTNQSPTIVLNQGTIRAMGEGAFGGGNISVAGASTIEYSASGNFGNAISLQIGAPSATNAVTLSADNGFTANVTGIISGAGQSVIINGAGTVMLSGTETYTGATTIANGTLNLGEAGSIADSSGVNLTSATSVLYAVRSFPVGSTPQISNLSGVSGSSVQFGSKGLTVTQTGATTFAGVISENGIGGNLTVNGSGDLTLTGLNSYTANTLVTGGATLTLGVDGALPSGGLITINDGGTLAAGNITFNGTMNVGETGTVTATNFNQTGGTVTLQSGEIGSVLNATTYNLSAGSLLVEGGEGGFGNLTAATFSQTGGDLTITGGETGGTFTATTYNMTAGNLTIEGGEAFSGGNLTATTFNQMGGNVTIGEGEAGGRFTATTYNMTAGNLTIEGGEAFSGGNLTATTFDQHGGNVTIYGGENVGGGTLTATTYNQSGGTILLQGGEGSLGILNAGTFNQTGGLLNIDGGIVTIGTLTGAGGAIELCSCSNLDVGGNDSSSTYGGAFSGDGTIEKDGTGTLTLAGDNSNYTGAFFVTDGTLKVGSATALGDHAGMGVVGNGTLDLNGFNAAVVLFGEGVVTDSSTTPSALTIGGSSDFFGVIQDGAGKLSLEVAEGQFAVLGGTNTYTGDTTVDQNALLLIAEGGSIANSAVIDNGTVDLSLSTSPNVSFTSLSGNGTVDMGGTTLVLSNANGTFSGVLQDGGEIGGTGAKLEIAGGRETLSGANIFTGTTTIDAGAVLQLGAGGTTGSVTGPIIDNGTLAFDLSTPTTLSTSLPGVGGLEVDMSTVTITAVQTTLVGASLIAPNATLALSGAGTLDVPLTDNGTFDISASTADQTIQSLAGNGTVTLGATNLTLAAANATFSGAINGSGGLALTGGTETLSGTNGYTGATTIGVNATLALSGTGSIVTSSGVADAGTFDISATTAGATVQTFTGAGLLVLGNQTLTIANASGTFSGVASGTGGITIAGGTETLSGANTYSGPTTIGSGATLALSGNGSLANSAIADNGTFDISGTANGALTGSLSGSGGVYLGGETLTIDNGNGTFAGNITDGGLGGKIILAGGTETLTGENTYSGGTTVGSGTTLIVGSPDSLGTGTITFGPNSTIQFTSNATFTQNAVFEANAPVFNVGGSTITYAGTLSGPGDLAVTGSGGTLVLTNTTNSYAGGTEVAGGATLNVGADSELGGAAPLQLGDATTAGTLQFASSFDLNSGRTITLNAGGGTIDTQAFDTTVAQAIGGTGGLAKLGSGTLTLGGTSTYTGATTVNAGTLLVTGSIGSSAVTVGSGATLGGTGAVGSSTVASGATLAPGVGGVGTLSVNGNLALASGSTTAIDVTPTAADKVAVSGTATLGGTLAISSAAGTYTPGTDYTIVSSSGLMGQFDAVTGGITGYGTTVVYSPTAVTFDITPVGPVIVTYAFSAYGVTPNEIAAGAALEAADPGGSLYMAVGNAVTSDPSAAPGKLNQLTGELHASARSALIEDGRVIRESVLDHLAQDPDGMTVWGTGFASDGHIDATGNTGKLHHTNGGFIAGVDTPVSEWVPDLRVGLAGAYNADHASISGLGSNLHGATGHVVAYAGWTGGPWAAKAGVDLGWGNTHITRDVSFLSETERSSQSTRTTQEFGDVGYNIALDAVALQPYADLANVNVKTGGFTETGGLAALSGGGAQDNVTYSTLGARISINPWTMGGWAVTPRADLGWQHAFSRLTPSDTLAFADNGENFSVAGAPLDKDAAALQGGLDIAITPQAVISLTYDGTFSSKVRDNTFRGGFIWKF